MGSANVVAFMWRFFRNYKALDITGNLGPEAEQMGRIQHNLNEPLPMDDESVDVVLAMKVFEHLFEPFFPFSGISRAYEAYRDRASEPSPLVTSVKNRARLLVGELPRTSQKDWWNWREWDGGHLHLCNIKSIRKLAEESGRVMTKV